MKALVPFLAAFLLAPGAALLAPGAALADAPPGVPAGKVVLPEKTEVKLALLKELKSGGDKAGEVVPYEVERDVFSPFPAHVLLLPAGTPAFGKVTKSNRRGMLGRGGKLEFTCEYVQALDGTKVPLRADPTKEKGRNNTGTSVAVAALLFAPMLLMSGRDVTVHKGQEVVAYVDQDTLLADPKADRADVPSPATPTPAAVATPVAPAAASSTLFTLTDGTQFVGTLLSFDGTTYVVGTASGSRSVAAAGVKSMTALPGAPASSPAAAAPAPTPAAPVGAPAAAEPAPAPAPTPRLPQINSFPQHARMELKNGNSYFGDVTAFADGLYTLSIPGGTLTIKEDDVKTLELLPSK